jgi:cation transport ATPase
MNLVSTTTRPVFLLAQLLWIAASCEASSEHPLARALVNAIAPPEAAGGASRVAGIGPRGNGPNDPCWPNGLAGKAELVLGVSGFSFPPLLHAEWFENEVHD